MRHRRLMRLSCLQFAARRPGAGSRPGSPVQQGARHPAQLPKRPGFQAQPEGHETLQELVRTRAFSVAVCTGPRRTFSSSVSRFIQLPWLSCAFLPASLLSSSGGSSCVCDDDVLATSSPHPELFFKSQRSMGLTPLFFLAEYDLLL